MAAGVARDEHGNVLVDICFPAESDLGRWQHRLPMPASLVVVRSGDSVLIACVAGPRGPRSAIGVEAVAVSGCRVFLDVAQPQLLLACTQRGVGRRAMNTYSRLSSVNGSRVNPP